MLSENEWIAVIRSHGALHGGCKHQGGLSTHCLPSSLVYGVSFSAHESAPLTFLRHASQAIHGMDSFRGNLDCLLFR